MIKSLLSIAFISPVLTALASTPLVSSTVYVQLIGNNLDNQTPTFCLQSHKIKQAFHTLACTAVSATMPKAEMIQDFQFTAPPKTIPAELLLPQKTRLTIAKPCKKMYHIKTQQQPRDFNGGYQWYTEVEFAIPVDQQPGKITIQLGYDANSQTLYCPLLRYANR